MPEIVNFPRITDPRGSLSIAERLPFAIKRCYWLFDLSADAERGNHAHKTLDRIIVPVSGSVTAKVDGKPYLLNKPWVGLRVFPGEWLDLVDFSGGAALMVFASAEYDEADYIR